MKKVIILMLLVLVPVCAFAWESYFDFSGVYITSNMTGTIDRVTITSKSTTLMFELAGSDYYENIGVIYKFRLGKVLTENDREVDSDLGYNNAFGLSLKYDVDDSVEVFLDVLYSWMKTSYEEGIHDFTLSYNELHFAPKAKYITDNGLTFNVGIDVGFLLSAKLKEEFGSETSLDVKGTRVMPFFGVGYKYKY